MQMINILIAEDDTSHCLLYSIVLEKAGYHTFCANDGQEAWDTLDREHIDLVITDIMMPVMDGYEFVRLLRRTNPVIPILMITAKNDFPSKSLGFSVGTDDYMTKPVDLDEMVLRVRALLRRSHIFAERSIHIGNTTLSYDSLTVETAGETITLPQKEFFLLYKFLSYPDKIFTRLQLMDEIWGRDSNSDAQTIDVHVNRLRRRFPDNPDFEIITVRGLGYKGVVKR